MRTLILMFLLVSNSVFAGALKCGDEDALRALKELSDNGRIHGYADKNIYYLSPTHFINDRYAEFNFFKYDQKGEHKYLSISLKENCAVESYGEHPAKAVNGK